MLTLSPTQAAVVALVCGAWLAIAVWATLRGISRARAAATERGAAGVGQVLLDASPALPLIVDPNGGLEGTAELAALFGLDRLPARLEGLDSEEWRPLRDEVGRTASTSASFAF